jgi:Ca2+-binding EF-hand superfamily protein
MAAFNMLDVDHDGVITKAELYEHFPIEDVKEGDRAIDINVLTKAVWNVGNVHADFPS